MIRFVEKSSNLLERAPVIPKGIHREVIYQLKDYIGNNKVLAFRFDADEGVYSISSEKGGALRNYQIKNVDSLYTHANNGNWSRVTEIINTGVYEITDIKYVTQKPKSRTRNRPDLVTFNLLDVYNNKKVLIFKKRSDGSYSVSGGKDALSNFQMKGDYKNELAWAVEKGEYMKAKAIIERGVTTVVNWEIK